MTHEYRYCPACGQPFAVTSTGRMYRHNNPYTSRPCAGSGEKPPRKVTA